MIDKQFIFICGHHRSGTSLLHEIMRQHHLISGFSETGVPEDEGQFLQSVYKPAKIYGGPGKYIFDKRAYMNEEHPLATEDSAARIMQQWEEYLDESCSHYIEKSPPNLIKTRFLQKIFPDSKFVVVLRHPIAVGFATQKWSNTSIKSLVEHTLRGYEIFMNDLHHLRYVYVLRYEEFVSEPQAEIDRIFRFLDIDTLTIQHQVLPDVNEKYYSMWQSNRERFINRILFPVNDALESRANKFGYSFRNYRDLVDSPVLGVHKST